MENNYKLEIKRQIFHLFSILTWIPVILIFPKFLVLAIMLLVLIVNTLLVFKVMEKRLPFIYELVYFLERQKNLKRPAIQALWANVGVFLSFLLFDRCALAGIATLAVGDAFSTMVGVRYGKRKFMGRSLEGSLAFVLSNFLALAPFYGLSKALVFSFVGALAEMLSKKVDDNLTIPLVVSFVCFMIP